MKCQVDSAYIRDIVSVYHRVYCSCNVDLSLLMSRIDIRIGFSSAIPVFQEFCTLLSLSLNIIGVHYLSLLFTIFVFVFSLVVLHLCPLPNLLSITSVFTMSASITPVSTTSVVHQPCPPSPPAVDRGIVRLYHTTIKVLKQVISESQKSSSNFKCVPINNVMAAPSCCRISRHDDLGELVPRVVPSFT